MTQVFCALLPEMAIYWMSTVCQVTDEVFILTASFSPHNKSVSYQPILQMRKPRLKEFRILLQVT